MKKWIYSYAILLLTVTLLCLTLSSCGGGELQTLYVYNWGEYISDGSEGSVDVNTAFEEYYYQKYGVRVAVNYSTYSSNEDMYAKISSGASVYDVVVPSDYMIQKMIDNDLLAELDFSKLPNATSNIGEQYWEQSKQFDTKNKYHF